MQCKRTFFAPYANLAFSDKIWFTIEHGRNREISQILVDFNLGVHKVTMYYKIDKARTNGITCPSPPVNHQNELLRKYILK